MNEADERWISVDEAIPGREDYRPCHESWLGAVWWRTPKEKGLGWYNDLVGQWQDTVSHWLTDVTHWRRIPDNFVEKKKESNDKSVYVIVNGGHEVFRGEADDVAEKLGCEADSIRSAVSSGEKINGVEVWRIIGSSERKEE